MRTWLFGILFHKIMEMRRVIERERQSGGIDAVMESRFDSAGSWSRPPAADAKVLGRGIR